MSVEATSTTNSNRIGNLFSEHLNFQGDYATVKKIAAVAGLVLASLVLCWISTSFFAVGLVVGLLISTIVIDAISDIVSAFNALSTWQKVVLVVGVMAIGAWFFLPHLMALSSFGFAVYLGSQLREYGNSAKPPEPITTEES